MKQKTFIITLILVFTIFSAVSAAELSDISSAHWAYQAVNDLVEMGILEGYPDGEFKGANELSRYEMAVIISRLQDSLKVERENLGGDLTAEETAEVEKIVEALIEENRGGESDLSDGQLEEIITIVDALTLEYASELEVLGADLKLLRNDISSIERKVSELRLPEDKIEFSLETGTYFETTDYPDQDEEVIVAMSFWADEELLDVDLFNADYNYIKNFYDYNIGYPGLLYTFFKGGGDKDFIDLFPNPNNFSSIEDIEDLPAVKRFWQEYDFKVNGSLKNADFSLELDTIANIFSQEDSVFNYQKADDNNFALDKALLNLDYQNYNFKIGDIEDYHIAKYFLNEEDLKVLEAQTNFKDTDIKVLTAGFGTNNQDSDLDIYLIEGARSYDIADFKAKIYHARRNKNNWIGFAEQYNLSNYALEINDYKINQKLNLDGEIVYNELRDDDILFTVNSEYIFNQDLSTEFQFESVGDDFYSFKHDLAGEKAYKLYAFSADYKINRNNTLMAGYSLVQPDDFWKELVSLNSDFSDINVSDKQIIDIKLENIINDFKNSMRFEYSLNDEFIKDYDERVFELKSIYQYNNSTKLGARFVNKNVVWDTPLVYEVNNNDRNLDTEFDITYNYLELFMDKELNENLNWNITAKYVGGNVDLSVRDLDSLDIDSSSSSLNTSLIVKF